MARSIVTFTTGLPGSGKTLTRVVWLCEEFLPRTKRVLVHNLPLHEEQIAEYVASQRRGRFAADYLERMRRIPEKVIDSWRMGLSGPWEYFGPGELKGCHLLIDEIHEMIATGSDQSLVKKWELWFGVIRKERCTVEFITQDPSRVHRAIQSRAGRRLVMSEVTEERDPFFKIVLEDWFRLWSSITRREVARPCVEVEFLKGGLFRSKDAWKVGGRRWRFRRPVYFGLYESFNTPDQDDLKDDEVHGVPPRSEALHFLARYSFAIFSRLVLVALVAWVLVLGGFGFLMSGGIGWFMRLGTPKVPAAEQVEQVFTVEQAGGSHVVETKSDSVSPVAGLPPEMVEWQSRLSGLQGQVQDALALLDRNLSHVRVVGRCEGGVVLVGGRSLRVGSSWANSTVVRMSWDGCELADGRWLQFIQPEVGGGSAGGLLGGAPRRSAGADGGRAGAGGAGRPVRGVGSGASGDRGRVAP